MLQYFTIKDYKQTNRLLRLWNNEFKNICPIRKQTFKTNIIDDINLNKNASFVALYDGQPVGFIFIKTWLTDSGFCNEENKAYISLIFVKKEMRNMGIGSDMLQLSIKEIKKHQNIKILEVGNDINNVLPGIPNEIPSSPVFFMNKGFIQKESVVDMIRIVRNDAYEEVNNSDSDLKIRIATEEDKDEILKLCIKNNWQRDAYLINSYFERGGTGRRIVVGEKDGKILAIARIYEENKLAMKINIFMKDNNVGGILFLDIDESLQKEEYDKIMDDACKNYLIQRNCKKVIVPATKKIQYYKKLGYSAFKYYLRFDMEI